MKIETAMGKVIIYLYKIKLTINSIDVLNKEIKNLFIALIKRYGFNFFGYSKVIIYHNKKYGSVLEIEKIYESLNSNIIDLKIIVYKNVPMYLEFDDFHFPNIPKNLIIKNDKYYLNVNDINNIIEYIEYAKINYNVII